MCTVVNYLTERVAKEFEKIENVHVTCPYSCSQAQFLPPDDPAGAANRSNWRRGKSSEHELDDSFSQIGIPISYLSQTIPDAIERPHRPQGIGLDYGLNFYLCCMRTRICLQSRYATRLTPCPLQLTGSASLILPVSQFVLQPH